MLANNPLRMDYYKWYQSIVSDYNREKNWATAEAIFSQLAKPVAELNEEEQRHVCEGLSETELTFFDMVLKNKSQNLTPSSSNRLAGAASIVG